MEPHILMDTSQVLNLLSHSGNSCVLRQKKREGGSDCKEYINLVNSIRFEIRKVFFSVFSAFYGIQIFF